MCVLLLSADEYETLSPRQHVSWEPYFRAMFSLRSITIERGAWTEAWYLFHQWIPDQLDDRQCFVEYIEDGTISFSNRVMDILSSKAQRYIDSHERLTLEVLEDLCRKSLIIRKMTCAYLSTLSSKALNDRIHSKGDILYIIDDLRVEINECMYAGTDSSERELINEIADKFQDLRFTHCPKSVEQYVSEDSNSSSLLRAFLEFCNPHKDFGASLSIEIIKFHLVNPELRELYAAFAERTVILSQLWYKLMRKRDNGQKTLDWMRANDWSIGRERLKTVRTGRKTCSGWSDNAKWKQRTAASRGTVTMSSQMIRINMLGGNLIHGAYARQVNAGVHGDLHELIRKKVSDAGRIQLLATTGNTQHFQGVPVPQAPPLSLPPRVSQIVSQDVIQNCDSDDSVETSEPEDETWIDEILERIHGYLQAFAQEWDSWNLSQLSEFHESNSDGQKFLKLGLECFMCTVVDAARPICDSQLVRAWVEHFDEVFQFEAAKSLVIFLGVLFRFSSDGVVNLDPFLDSAVPMAFDFWLDAVEDAGGQMGVDTVDMPAWVWRVTARVIGTDQMGRVSDLAVRCELNEETQSRLNMRLWKEYARMARAGKELIPAVESQTMKKIRDLLHKQSMHATRATSVF